jgi:hypothetical protein
MIDQELKDLVASLAVSQLELTKQRGYYRGDE